MNKPLPPARVAAYIKAALSAGLKVGEFDVRATDAEVTILTHAAAAPATSNQDDEAWAKGLAKWRKSA